MIVKIAQYPDGRRRIIIQKLRNKEPIQVILDSFGWRARLRTGFYLRDEEGYNLWDEKTGWHSELTLRKIYHKYDVVSGFYSFAADIPVWLADKFNALPDNRAR